MEFQLGRPRLMIAEIAPSGAMASNRSHVMIYITSTYFVELTIPLHPPREHLIRASLTTDASKDALVAAAPLPSWTVSASPMVFCSFSYLALMFVMDILVEMNRCSLPENVSQVFTYCRD